MKKIELKEFSQTGFGDIKVIIDTGIRDLWFSVENLVENEKCLDDLLTNEKRTEIIDDEEVTFVNTVGLDVLCARMEISKPKKLDKWLKGTFKDWIELRIKRLKK